MSGSPKQREATQMESHCFSKCNNSHKNVCAQKVPKGIIIGFFFEQRLRAYRKRPDPSRLHRVRIFFRSKTNSSAINHNWIKLKYLPRLPPGFGAFVGAEPTPIKQRIKLRTKFRRFYRRTWLVYFFSYSDLCQFDLIFLNQMFLGVALEISLKLIK